MCLQVLQQQTGINLQLFLGFLRTANLTAAFMDSTAAATIFVPTDEAIRSGLTQQGMQLQTVQQNTNLLRDIIFYHVVPVTQGGSRLAAAQLTNGLTLQSSLTSPQVRKILILILLAPVYSKCSSTENQQYCCL